MRSDVAARYRDLRSNPQKIIYSTIPLSERTDYLPARSSDSSGTAQATADANDFVLNDGSSAAITSTRGNQGSGPAAPGPGRFVATAPASPAPDILTTQTASPSAAAPAPVQPAQTSSDGKPVVAAVAPVVQDGPDKPQSTTPEGKQVVAAVKNAASEKSAPTEVAGDAVKSAADSKPSAGAPSKPRPPVDSDDLFAIAVQEQREGNKRRVEKQAERQKKQMLIPCACGAWIRVLIDQAGKSVRCRQCKQPVIIPEIRRKPAKNKATEAIPKVNVNWINDVWLHVFAPTSLVLKPGSLVDKHTESDLAFTESGLQFVAFGAVDKKKKGASFGSTDKKTDRPANRKLLRDQILSTGVFQNLKDAELRSIEAAKISELRVVQPVTKAHESMFAGVPVFGEGRIAIFLPLTVDGGQQAFCSCTLSEYRIVAEQLKSLFGIDLPSGENGIPDAEKIDTLSCFVNQSKIEAVRNLIYYQKDPAFKLELTGYRCTACGTAVSEEGRKKNKLGGANGKGIAKAKCPKCSGKMGEDPLYKVTKVAESTP